MNSFVTSVVTVTVIVAAVPGLAQPPDFSGMWTLDQTASDFTEPGWAEGLGGPFDLAVSAIAVHNLGPDGAIPVVYRGVWEVLKPRASFLNLDFPQFAGGLERHLGWLREAGFARAERAWEVGIQSAMAAYKG